jgi:putative heme utilization carrier protein HutX
MGRLGFHGHLRHDRCAAIAFVERPFMGRTSALLIFINGEGDIMFKVFIGRDDKGALKEDQLARFRALRDRLAGAARSAA